MNEMKPNEAMTSPLLAGKLRERERERERERVVVKIEEEVKRMERQRRG